MATASLLMLLRVKSLSRLDRHLSSLINNNYQQQIIRRNTNILHYCVKIPDTEGNVYDSNVKKKPKTKVETKITLLSSDNSMTVVSLEDAQKLAKRRKLILTKVENEKKSSTRDTYKLLNPSEQLNELKIKDNSDKEKNEIKGIKLIMLSAKISMYDLDVKLKNINRLLKKRHTVKLIINHVSEMPDKILKYVESSIKQHGKIQKVLQPMRTVLTITPILNDNDNSHNIDVKTQKK